MFKVAVSREGGVCDRSRKRGRGREGLMLAEFLAVFLGVLLGEIGGEVAQAFIRRWFRRRGW